jgi:hypothetical protein
MPVQFRGRDPPPGVRQLWNSNAHGIHGAWLRWTRTMPTRHNPHMRELWLSGPVEGVHPLLVPAVHTFLQVRDDVRELLAALSIEQLWTKLGQSAAIGFHAVHLAGATDRLLTYARGETLSDAQLEQVRGGEQSIVGLDSVALISRVDHAMDAAIEQLRATSETTLLQPRYVGRKQLPSTTLGLITHAAEHAYRHAGQIATLRRIVRAPLSPVEFMLGPD